MNILSIDTSTSTCVVGLQTKFGIFERRIAGVRRHAEQLLCLIESLLDENKLQLADIDKLAFGKGPGSFTGLRIAACVVQGLACAHDIPVVGISTLQAIAQGVHRRCKYEHIWVVNDARMGEVYHAPFVLKAGLMQPVADEKVEVLEQINLNDNSWHFVGSGLSHHQSSVEKDEDFIFADELIHLALNLAGEAAHLALPSYIRNQVTHQRN
jgi:tRNA threonylcarbamoyladenosine biosynthesis protein TsaB